MDSYRIVLADDHVIFRQGMKRLIDEMPGLSVVGEAADGLELLKLLKGLSTDMVLLDISMPNLRGIEATREIKLTNSQIKVLMLTMHKNKQYLYHAISAGAQGFLLKEDTEEELFSAIETIRKGGGVRNKAPHRRAGGRSLQHVHREETDPDRAADDTGEGSLEADFRGKTQ